MSPRSRIFKVSAVGLEMARAQKKQPMAKTSDKEKGKASTTSGGRTPKAWNKGRKQSKTDKQHVFIPREDLELFLAVALFFAGPCYCAALWVALVTSRRISETLLLRGTDVQLNGGAEHDEPHVLFQKREEDKKIKGNGKLGANKLVARLSAEAIDGMKELENKGLQWTKRDILQKYEESHKETFLQKPLRTKTFTLDTSSDAYMFPAETKKKGAGRIWLDNLLGKPLKGFAK